MDINKGEPEIDLTWLVAVMRIAMWYANR